MPGGKARTEHAEQVILVGRIRAFHPDVLVYAVPNGGGRTAWDAGRLKAEGVLAGVPDLVVAEPRGQYHGLYVEMKRTVGGAVSKKQGEVMAKLRDRGYKVLVCDQGAEDAFERVEAYLALPPDPRVAEARSRAAAARDLLS